jgi:hypothetical protein
LTLNEQPGMKTQQRQKIDNSLEAKQAIEELLQSDSSRAMVEITAQLVNDDPQLIAFLMEKVLDEMDPESQRAIRVVDLCSERNPRLMLPHLNKIAEQLSRLKSDSVKRGFVKILSRYSNSGLIKKSGLIIDICFKWLVDPIQPVALRVYSITLLYNYSIYEPDLQQELIAIIEGALPQSPTSLKNRSKKILKLLKSRQNHSFENNRQEI